MKPSARPARLPELTPEQKAEKVAMFLSQKRESFAVTILAGLMHNPSVKLDTNLNLRFAVLAAVDAADALIDKLYPVEPGKEEAAE